MFIEDHFSLLTIHALNLPIFARLVTREMSRILERECYVYIAVT